MVSGHKPVVRRNKNYNKLVFSGVKYRLLLCKKIRGFNQKTFVMRKVSLFIVFVVTILSFISCSRGITPYEAANGRARCGRYIR